MTLTVFVNLTKMDPRSSHRLDDETVSELKSSIRRGLNAAHIRTGPDTDYE